MIGVIRHRGLDEHLGDIEISSCLRDRPGARLQDHDDLPDPEAGSHDAGTPPGRLISEVDPGMVDPAEPLVDEALGERGVRLARLGCPSGEALRGARAESEGSMNAAKIGHVAQRSTACHVDG